MKKFVLSALLLGVAWAEEAPAAKDLADEGADSEAPGLGDLEEEKEEKPVVAEEKKEEEVTEGEEEKKEASEEKKADKEEGEDESEEEDSREGDSSDDQAGKAEKPGLDFNTMSEDEYRKLMTDGGLKGDDLERSVKQWTMYKARMNMTDKMKDTRLNTSMTLLQAAMEDDLSELDEVGDVETFAQLKEQAGPAMDYVRKMIVLLDDTMAQDIMPQKMVDEMSTKSHTSRHIRDFKRKTDVLARAAQEDVTEEKVDKFGDEWWEDLKKLITLQRDEREEENLRMIQRRMETEQRKQRNVERQKELKKLKKEKKKAKQAKQSEEQMIPNSVAFAAVSGFMLFTAYFTWMFIKMVKKNDETIKHKAKKQK